MTKVEVGQIWKLVEDGTSFEVLCIDEDECFVKWLDGGYHRVLDVNAVSEWCVLIEQAERSE